MSAVSLTLGAVAGAADVVVPVDTGVAVASAGASSLSAAEGLVRSCAKIAVASRQTDSRVWSVRINTSFKFIPLTEK